MGRNNLEQMEILYWKLVGFGLVDAQKQPFKLEEYTSARMKNPDRAKLLTSGDLATQLPTTVRISAEEDLFDVYKKALCSPPFAEELHNDRASFVIPSKNEVSHEVSILRDIYKKDRLNLGDPFALVSLSLDYQLGRRGNRSRMNARVTLGEDFGVVKYIFTPNFTLDVKKIKEDILKSHKEFLTFNPDLAIDNLIGNAKTLRDIYG